MLCERPECIYVGRFHPAALEAQGPERRGQYGEEGGDVVDIEKEMCRGVHGEAQESES